MRMARLASVLLLIASSAGAQPSTDRLLTSGPAIRWEAGIGGEWLAFTGDPSGSVVASHGGVRTELGESPVAFRLDAIMLGRYFSARDQNGQPVAARHVVIGALAGIDIEIPFGRDASFAPMFGVGPAPLARATGQLHDSGTLLMAGLQLRFGHLLVRQQFISLDGADRAIRQFREYYPLTVGWRF
jgi:hypothetical protein